MEPSASSSIRKLSAREEIPVLRVAIVGAGREGTALLQLLHRNAGIQIVGISDQDCGAPGLQLACQLGIPGSQDVRDLLKGPPPHLLIDATRDPEEAAALKAMIPATTAILPGSTARILWSLNQEQTDLPAIVQESVEAIINLDLQERISFWNRGAEQLLGYRSEEILGQSISILVPLDRTGEIQKIRNHLKEHGFLRDYETERVGKDGTRIPVTITVTEVRDEKGQRLSLTAVLRDIRESKKRTQEKEARYQELKALHEISKITLSSSDLEAVLEEILDKALTIGSFDLGIIRLLDRAGEKLETVVDRGYQNPENVQRHPKNTRDPHTGSIITRVMTYKKARVEENVPECDGLRTIKREGPKSAIVVPVRAQEEVLGVLVLASRTPHKFFPPEIHLLEAIGSQVGIAVQKARLYEDARQAYEKLKATHDRMIQVERLRALGELASGVAHDFNNLLTAILGRTEVLLEKVQDPAVRKSLEVIQKATLDGASAVQRVQEFARFKEEEPNTTSVDLAAIVADAIEFTRSRWRKEPQAAGISITVRNECKNLPPVLGSPSQLREVFTNLILNAVDAMPQGGTISFRAQTNANTILLEVSDTGIGIPPEAQQRIFEPFFTTKNQKGTGLGLSIVEGIIQRHQGSIRVTSREGQGTTFTIQLPTAAPVADSQPTELPVDTGPTGNILVIDDEEPVREILCDILELAGYRAQAAASGPEGLALLKERKYDLVITDLRMPEMNGWEVARAIKGPQPHLPVVLVTAWGKELTRKQTQGNGIAAVVTKPFRSREITDTVRELLAGEKKSRHPTPRAKESRQRSALKVPPALRSTPEPLKSPKRTADC